MSRRKRQKQWEKCRKTVIRRGHCIDKPRRVCYTMKKCNGAPRSALRARLQSLDQRERKRRIRRCVNRVLYPFTIFAPKGKGAGNVPCNRAPRPLMPHRRKGAEFAATPTKKLNAKTNKFCCIFISFSIVFFFAYLLHFLKHASMRWMDFDVLAFDILRYKIGIDHVE